MKRYLFLTTVLILGCFACDAQGNPLSSGATLLFKNVDGNLTNSEKNEIFNLTQFEISDNGTQFSSIGDEGTVENPLDINQDGKTEVIVIWGNSYTSGEYGHNSTLFIKNPQGKYETNFGFPSDLILTTPKNTDFPDILLGGPGFEPYTVWQWNGKAYDFTPDKIDQDKAEKLGLTYDIESASKKYVASLKN
ncbi:MAG TPA: hypothetical protein VKX40_10175 [Aequorivita sp.]|nr:hypothetical protein [Aequorivita sp.]